MANFTAKVNFEKMVQHDNWEHGCGMEHWTTYHETFYINFTDTDNLKEELAKWISNHFDVSQDDFLKHVNNDCELDRFDYNQNEDGNADKMDITQENPDGYLADYMFWIAEVTQKVDYKFE